MVQNQPISKAVIAGIVAASLLGLVSIIAITIFLVSQCRKRRAILQGNSQGPDGQSPVLPIQHPDLEACLGSSEKKPAAAGKRSTNRFTMKSVASRWSQASYASGQPPGGGRPSEIPPVPAMPMPVSLPANPKLSMPVPQHTRAASSGGSSRSSTLYSPDGDSVLDNYYYRQSVGSQNSVSSYHRIRAELTLTTDFCFPLPRTLHSGLRARLGCTSTWGTPLTMYLSNVTATNQYAACWTRNAVQRTVLYTAASQLRQIMRDRALSWSRHRSLS